MTSAITPDHTCSGDGGAYYMSCEACVLAYESGAANRFVSWYDAKEARKKQRRMYDRIEEVINLDHQHRYDALRIQPVCRCGHLLGDPANACPP